MVLEGFDGPFNSNGLMHFWRDMLEGHVVLGEGLFDVIGALIVQDVEVGWMAIRGQEVVKLLPCRL